MIDFTGQVAIVSNAGIFNGVPFDELSRDEVLAICDRLGITV